MKPIIAFTLLAASLSFFGCATTGKKAETRACDLIEKSGISQSPVTYKWNGFKKETVQVQAWWRSPGLSQPDPTAAEITTLTFAINGAKQAIPQEALADLRSPVLDSFQLFNSGKGNYDLMVAGDDFRGAWKVSFQFRNGDYVGRHKTN